MEALPEFRLHRPATVEEALRLRAAEPQSAYVAGGTDLIVNMRRGIERPGALIDLSAVAALKAIAVDEGGMTIGAAVPLAELAEIGRDWPAVAVAAAQVAGPTHRAYATVGGNLCLDTRCLYYNQSEWWRASNNYCLKERGSVCHVAPGGSFCFAAFSGDLAPALLVHGAEVRLIGPEGERRIALDDLYRSDGARHLDLRPGELLLSVTIPKARPGTRSAYAKARIRGAIDFPLAGVAVALRMADGNLSFLEIALTGLNPRPLRVPGLDDLLGRPLDPAALDALRDRVRAAAQPMPTTTAKPWYRRRVAGNLARRLAAQLAAA